MRSQYGTKSLLAEFRVLKIRISKSYKTPAIIVRSSIYLTTMADLFD